MKSIIDEVFINPKNPSEYFPYLSIVIETTLDGKLRSHKLMMDANTIITLGMCDYLIKKLHDLKESVHESFETSSVIVDDSTISKLIHAVDKDYELLQEHNPDKAKEILDELKAIEANTINESDLLDIHKRIRAALDLDSEDNIKLND
jgi:hypothetical protein